MERRTFSRVENNHVDRIFSSLSSSPTVEGGSFSAGLASARTVADIFHPLMEQSSDQLQFLELQFMRATVQESSRRPDRTKARERRWTNGGGGGRGSRGGQGEAAKLKEECAESVWCQNNGHAAPFSLCLGVTGANQTPRG